MKLQSRRLESQSAVFKKDAWGFAARNSSGKKQHGLLKKATVIEKAGSTARTQLCTDRRLAFFTKDTE